MAKISKKESVQEIKQDLFATELTIGTIAGTVVYIAIIMIIGSGDNYILISLMAIAVILLMRKSFLERKLTKKKYTSIFVTELIILIIVLFGLIFDYIIMETSPTLSLIIVAVIFIGLVIVAVLNRIMNKKLEISN